VIGLLRNVSILCVLISLFLVGCANNEINSSSGLIMDETVLYPENEPPTIKIKVGKDWREIATTDDYPSKPEINSDKTKLAFISPFEFEMVGEVWLYDIANDKNEKIFSKEQSGTDSSARRLLWFDTHHLIIVTGNTFGTVSSNRTLYLLDTHNNNLHQIFQAETNQDIRDLVVSHATSISFTMATYNEDSTDFFSEDKTVDISSFLDQDK
jgi:hypothetical protein